MVRLEEEDMLPRLHGSLNAARLVTASGDWVPGGGDDGRVESCHWFPCGERGGGGRIAPPFPLLGVHQSRHRVAVDVVRAAV